MEQLINNIAEMRKSAGKTQGAVQGWGTGTARAAPLGDWLFLALAVPRWVVAAGEGGRHGGWQREVREQRGRRAAPAHVTAFQGTVQDT